MYSRNRNRPRDDYEDDIRDGMSEDEYEIYRYDLPPKYDGSRFRRRVGHGGAEKNAPKRVIEAEYHESRPSPPQIKEAELWRNEDERDAFREEECLTPVKEHRDDTQGLHDILMRFCKRLGYEEILIIALILIVAHDGKGSGDVILLLSLILLAG